MKKEEILIEASSNLRRRMEEVWDIRKNYWYPLSECDRHDIIAFNSDYTMDEEKLNEIISLLKEHGEEQVIEFLETGETYKIEVTDL